MDNVIITPDQADQERMERIRKMDERNDGRDNEEKTIVSVIDAAARNLSADTPNV